MTEERPEPFDIRNRKIVEYLPYTTREVSDRQMMAGFEIMLHYCDAIGITKGTHHIEEFYKGKPVLIGLPWKRYKFNRN